MTLVLDNFFWMELSLTLVEKRLATPPDLLLNMLFLEPRDLGEIMFEDFRCLPVPDDWKGPADSLWHDSFFWLGLCFVSSYLRLNLFMTMPCLLSLALDLPLLRPETKVSWMISGVLES